MSDFSAYLVAGFLSRCEELRDLDDAADREAA